ncbi:alpha-amylase family glycosyl hydrolase [Marinilabilia sp.]|uniref:alpha-amylase family glycosyl hydrolase n=1 Tax=Marinilabilia sp. TaxID=2021252 RepID=UPI0025BDDD12|nr:alpha-amylase family glycosyl hydrolase [Marinilabilia sp.]
MKKRLIFITQLLLFPLILSSCEKKNEEEQVITEPVQEQFTQYGTPFENVPETRDITMYEVNLRAFSREGNLNGVTAKLDSLDNLGINVVWLMPVYPTGDVKSVGSPYAVKDYLDIHEDYGTLEDLRNLVREAHQRDIAVILDWVANHTAWDHKWIADHSSWYAKDDNGNNIIPPGTGWQDVAELNFGNEYLREEMIRAMKYWVLEANVDGFRCDYVHGVPDDFWKQAIDTLRSIPERDIIMFAESERKELLPQGFDMIFGWRFYTGLKETFSEGKSTDAIVEAHEEEYRGLSAEKEVLRWTSNHDQNAWETTPIQQFTNKEGAMAAFVIMAFMDGVPLVYSGQEVGFPEQLSFFEGNANKIDWDINAGYKAEYERLLNLRQDSPALRRGTFTNLNTADVMAFEKVTTDDSVLVIVNVRNNSVRYIVPEALQETVWQNAYSETQTTLGSKVELAPYEYLILRK